MTFEHEELLDKALIAFGQETGLTLHVTERDTEIDGLHIDALIQLPETNQNLAVEIKRWAQQANLGALAEQIKRLPTEGILIADYVNPNMSRQLKELDIQFLDTAGNAYIKQLPLYVYITGIKAKEAPVLVKESNRAFEQTGLKVIFGFLCKPELVNKAYRDIAQQTGVAVGTVGWVINGLKDAGFILEKDRQRELQNRRKLLDRWVETYPEKLLPKHYYGEFIADNPDWWKKIDITEFGALWGGEIAATKYTNHLIPKIGTIYLPKEAGNQLLGKARLHKSENHNIDDIGHVKIYRPFWPTELSPPAELGLVHPILVYADLIATGDARNIETARIIYERYIAKHIGTDIP